MLTSSPSEATCLAEANGYVRTSLLRRRLLSIVGQHLIRKLSTAPPGQPLRTRLYRYLVAAIRRIDGADDSTLSYVLEGRAIALPVSHDLPLNVAWNPSYGSNLTRVVRAVSEKYPSPAAIDIGANVGDSAIRMLAGGASQILSIEGDTVFARYLEQNTRDIAEVEIECAFVLPHATGVDHLRVSRAAGTARLCDTGDVVSSRLITFRDVLADHSAFRNARVIKIDTDGFDLPIAIALVEELGSARPVLFVEYDPEFYEAGEPVTYLEGLAELGYERALIWDNRGEYMLSVALRERDLLRELTAYLANGRRKGYFDIALFEHSELDVLDDIRDSERRVFSSRWLP